MTLYPHTTKRQIMGQSTTAGDVRLVTLGIEKKYGLPEDMLFKQSGIESSHGKAMLSPKGAQGWFGFIPGTAKEYGLTDPNDLTLSADAAGRKMRDLLKKHDGNVDYALVDYNGGGKAVKALQAGTPWGASAGYLAKYHGVPVEDVLKGNYTKPASATMGDQFTSQSSLSPTDGPLATELALAQRRHDAEFGGVINGVRHLPSAVSLGFQTQNSLWNWYADKSVTDHGEGVDWDSDEAKSTLKEFPERHWPYLLQGTSQAGLQARAERLKSTMDKERQLGDYGIVPSVAGGIVGGLLDIDTAIAFLPGMGATAFLTKASRLRNAVRMGALGAATNVGVDLTFDRFKPTATVNDRYVSALFGFGFGAAIGGAQSLRKLALAEEQAALRKYTFGKGVEEYKKEILESGILPGPAAVSPPTFAPREEFLKKLDMWAGGMGKEPQVPRVAILRGEPPEPVKGPKAEAPGLPPRQPFAAPVKPEPANPSGKPWAPQWDNPVRRERMGAPNILELPPLRKISHLADYVRTYSQNTDIVALMDRALKGLDLRKIKFDVVDPKHDLGGLNVSGHTAGWMDRAFGVVRTPYGSTGDGIEMALRGYGWGQKGHGLNEETFVHELLHAATVYKWHRVETGNTHGMRKESIQAFRELESLYDTVKKSAGTMPRNIRHDTFMSNSKEFISYGLTNRPFQEWLKSVEVAGEKTTLWGKFTEGLRKMLGMAPTESNAYAKLIDLTEGLLDKSGIEGRAKTRADLQRVGEFIDPEDADAANAAGIPTVFGWGLGLEHKLGNAKLPPAVRDLASSIFGTTVGYKDHAVVKRNAWDETLQRAEGWTADMRKGTYTAFDKWFKESGKAFHEKGQAFEDFGTQVGNYVRGFERDFHPEVKKAGNHLRKLYADVLEEINNPAKRDGGVKKGLTETEVRDEATGQTLLVGKLQRNDNYLPRKHDAQKWDEMVRTWGRDAVEGWWAGAYAKVHPDASPEAAKRWAGWYTRTVEEAHMNRSADHLEEMMTGYDEKALRESLMRNGGFSEQEARDIIRDMFKDPSSDAGRTASSLRHRNTISETHTEKWKNKAGEEVDVSINDFIRSNALDVSASYFRRTASSIALADRLGVYKQSDIGRLIDDATSKTFGMEGFSEAAAVQAKKDLKFAMDRVQGIPQEEFSTLNKSLSMWRDFNVIRLMGGAVWNQVTELSQIVGSMGWKATLGAVGELKALRRDIATGKAPNDFLDHLENTIGGAGSEYVARLDFSPKDDWVRYKGDTKANQRLDAFDAGQKKIAKGVLDYTGMTGVMIQQKRIHAIALANHFINAANGAPSKFLSKDRLAWMGMTEADYGNLNAALKAYSTPAQKGQYGAKVGLDIKRFAKEAPEAHSMFMNALHRETRRVVQENDLASMVPIMGTTLGKTVFQFMNFTIHGWNKSMLFAMNHRDWSTLSTVMHGSLFASLAYLGRTQLSALGMEPDKKEEFLTKRLSNKQIVANSFAKMSQASLLPTVYDSTVGNFTGAMFSGARTTSDLTSFASNPTLQAVNGVLSLGKIVRNAASDDYQTTSKDIKTWGKLLPLNNTMLISPFLNALANDYPNDEDATK